LQEIIVRKEVEREREDQDERLKISQTKGTEVGGFLSIKSVEENSPRSKTGCRRFNLVIGQKKRKRRPTSPGKKGAGLYNIVGERGGGWLTRRGSKEAEGE